MGTQQDLFRSTVVVDDNADCIFLDATEHERYRVHGRLPERAREAAFAAELAERDFLVFTRGPGEVEWRVIFRFFTGRRKSERERRALGVA